MALLQAWHFYMVLLFHKTADKGHCSERECNYITILSIMKPGSIFAVVSVSRYFCIVFRNGCSIALPAIGGHCTSAAVLIGCHAQRNGPIESNGEM